MKKIFGIDKIGFVGILKNILIIITGSVITSVGISVFLIPHKFLSGGVSGLSQFASYLTGYEVGTYVLILNVPVFIFGIMYLGRSFIIGSLFGTIALSLGLYSTAWMSGMGWAPEPLLAAVIGGALSGGGTGLVFRANSSHGGTDIVAAVIRKRWSMSIGTIAFVFNAVVLLILGLIYGLHVALYSVVVQFCSSMALDKIMLGFDRRRAVFIISNEPHRVADLIMKKLNRGVTFLDGEGAYMGRKQKVIYCIVSIRQLARVKFYVQSVDPQAFMTVAEVSEVMGKGFKAMPI